MFFGPFDQNGPGWNLEKAQKMPTDLAMVGCKRGREGPVSGGSDGPSKRGGCGGRGKVVFECTICGKACSRSDHLTVQMPVLWKLCDGATLGGALRDAQRSFLQGHLAHKKTSPCLGPPWGPRHSPTVGS